MPTLDNAALLEILAVLAAVNAVLAGVALTRFFRRRQASRAQVLAVNAGPGLTPGQLGIGAAATVDTPAEHDAAAAQEPADPGDAPGDAGVATAMARGLVDPGTGLETSLAWEEAIRHEEARAARYGRPATVVVVELEGLERLADLLGEEAAEKLIAPVAETLRRNSRTADCVARVGRARFWVLMPETDELAAINYVERIRDSADMWLEAGAVAVRVAIGWASAPAHGSLADAMRLADELMQADRRKRARPRPPRRVPALAERRAG